MGDIYQYKTIIVTYDNDIGPVGDDALSSYLESGWGIYRADSSTRSIVYVLKRVKEVQLSKGI